MSKVLIESLQNPRLYSHPVESFKVIETHISWVILTGPYAYKIKKPMDFGFLDFTTLEKRKQYCLDEVRLNQRLTTGLYLEVLPIAGSETEPTIGGEGQPFEYMIKMRQFPQSALLSELHANGQLTVAHIEELAEQLAHFHLITPKVAKDHPLNSPEVVMAPVRQNFEQMLPIVTAENLDRQQLDTLEKWAEDAYKQLLPVLEKRAQQGYVRECHGDVHLNNAAVVDGEVVLFDCIEFNESFRLTDVASDVGFLMMDLEDKGLHGLANHFLNRYLEVTGDYELLEVLNFYKAYRAVVRAKIALFSLGHVANSTEKEEVLQQYNNYAGLAMQYTKEKTPALLITYGVSGVGKSYAALQVVDQLGAVRIRSDVERKRLFSQLSGDQLYHQETTQKTYSRLYALAEIGLRSGYRIVLDAAYLKQDERQKVQALAQSLAVPFAIIACEASLEIIEQNMAKRLAEGNDPSDATLAVVEQQLTFKEPLSDEEQSVSYHVETRDSESLTAFIMAIRHRLG